MEVYLNEIKDYNYFELQYKNQNVANLTKFKEWYENVKKYINKENKLLPVNDFYFSNKYLIISFCPFCNSYVICNVDTDFCFIKCTKCNDKFCIGCLIKPLHRDEKTTCFKGYLKLMYYRIKDRRSDFDNFGKFLYFIHIMVCLFLTPVYLTIISCYLGFTVHRKRRQHLFDRVLGSGPVSCSCLIFSFIRRFLMFPYKITFFPFMVILFYLFYVLLSPIFMKN